MAQCRDKQGEECKLRDGKAEGYAVGPHGQMPYGPMCQQHAADVISERMKAGEAWTFKKHELEISRK
jgi:hypothetical protein